MLAGLELRRFAGCQLLGRADALDVRDIQRAPRVIVDNGSRIPAHGDEAGETRFAWLEGNHGDGVLCAVADVERATGRIKHERVGRGTKQVGCVATGPDRFHDSVRAGVDDAERVARGIRDDEEASIRRQSHRRGMQADDQFFRRLFAGEIDDRHRTFVRDVAHRIDAHQRAAPGGTGDAVGRGTAATPVAHVSLCSLQHHVVRRHADIPGPKQLACVRIELAEAVREIERDVELAAIRREHEASGNLSFAIHRLHLGERDGEERRELVLIIDPEDLHAAVHIREINATTVRREDQSREAHLPVLVRLEDVRRDGVRSRRSIRLRRQPDALNDAAGARIDDDQLRRLA